jgi:ATP-binding cassette subfamily F protein uup
MLIGEEPTDRGKVVIGDTIVFGYYSQDLIKVDDNKKVIDVVKDVAEFIPLEKGKELSAAQLLERFLFNRDMHYNFVHKLSGGEKRRLKLLKVLMSNPNFLILDEPTNDLDIFAMSVLEEYLRGFQGCLVVVSHDRYFMDKMVDHLFVFEGEGVLKDIVGNYTEFRKAQIQKARNSKDNKTTTEKPEKDEFKEKLISTSNEKRKLSFKEKAEFESLERDLELLEEKKNALTEALLNPENSSKLYEIGQDLGVLVTELESKTDRWLELSEFV